MFPYRVIYSGTWHSQWSILQKQFHHYLDHHMTVKLKKKKPATLYSLLWQIRIFFLMEQRGWDVLHRIMLYISPCCDNRSFPRTKAIRQTAKEITIVLQPKVKVNMWLYCMNLSAEDLICTTMQSAMKISIWYLNIAPVKKYVFSVL